MVAKKSKSRSKKKSFNPLKKKKKEKKADKLDPRIERIYEEWIERKDPITGKITRQKVKITRYKSAGELAEKHVIPSKDTADEIDNLDNGLHIYSAEEKESGEKEE
jgi:hypothetical protein